MCCWFNEVTSTDCVAATDTADRWRMKWKALNGAFEGSMCHFLNCATFGNRESHFYQGDTRKADSHIACRAHAVPLPCRAAKGLECVFPIWFTQCGRVWFTLAMTYRYHAPTMPFLSRPRNSTSVERWPVGYLPAFGFFRLPRGVPRRLLSEAYQSQMQVASVKPKNVCHGRGKEW